jgi:hypothetical protein
MAFAWMSTHREFGGAKEAVEQLSSASKSTPASSEMLVLASSTNR